MSATVFKRLRQPPRRGAVFAYHFSGLPYGLGAVVRESLPQTAEDCMLLYIFRSFPDDPQALSTADAQELLIAPIVVGVGLWKHGYFSHSRDKL